MRTFNFDSSFNKFIIQVSKPKRKKEINGGSSDYAGALLNLIHGPLATCPFPNVLFQGMSDFPANEFQERRFEARIYIINSVKNYLQRPSFN